MTQAACKGADPGIFFDERDNFRFWYPSPEALLLCRSCPVRVQCLDYALRRRHLVGTWGGTSDYQRKMLKRKLPRRRCPVCEGEALVNLSNHGGAPTLTLCRSCGMSWDSPTGTRPGPDELPLPAGSLTASA
jgi:WhiB family redox-sensing transcriptional regulator